MAGDSQDSENHVSEFGETNNTTKQGKNGKMWTTREAPKGYTNEHVDKISPGYDPNMWAQVRPNGKWHIESWGKNPEVCDRDGIGNHSMTLKDGSKVALSSGAGNHSVNMGNATHTGRGSTDTVTNNVVRDNTGSQGGYQHGSGQAGHAVASVGPMASYSSSTASKQHACQGNIKISSGEGCVVIGSNDDGGKYKSHVVVYPDGTIQVKGKGDVSILAAEGNLKLAAGPMGSGRRSEMTLGKDGGVSISAGGGTMSISGASSIGLGAPVLKIPDQLAKTTYPAERGIADSQYLSQTNSFGGQNQPGNSAQSLSTICPFGYHWDIKLMKCVLNNEVICQQGYHWDFNKGECVLDDTANTLVSSAQGGGPITAQAPINWPGDPPPTPFTTNISDAFSNTIPTLVSGVDDLSANVASIAVDISDLLAGIVDGGTF